MAYTMRTNIVRMRKRFCPVISRERDIEKALDFLVPKCSQLLAELNKEKGTDRNIIYM